MEMRSNHKTVSLVSTRHSWEELRNLVEHIHYLHSNKIKKTTQVICL